MVRRRELQTGGLKGGLPSCRECAIPLLRGVMGTVVEAADGRTGGRFLFGEGLLRFTGRAPEFYAPEDAGWLGVDEDLHVSKPGCLKAVVSLGSLLVSVYPSVQYHCSDLSYAKLFGRGEGTTRCSCSDICKCVSPCNKGSAYFRQ